ncbi:MAG: LPS export ABC transporter periplasmic protein LptC [Candidatus Puniceispirillaceae bacterium]|jgi:lipopolysaccharide export system protein LptC
MAPTPSSSKRRQFTPRTRSVQDEQRPSRRLSVVLVGVGVAVTLVVASWLGFLHQSGDSKLEIKEVKIANSGEIALTGARYQGVTSSGQPFLITADQASEANDGSGRIDMQQPRATITMKNGQIIKLQSNYGVFDQPDDVVDMAGDVVVTQPAKNLKLASDALFADLKLGEMRSLVPVTVTDDARRIDAETMTVFDNGDRIQFGGTARMVMQTTNTTAN